MSDQIAEIEKELAEVKERLAAARHALPREEIENFSFESPDGSKKLSDLFGDRFELILIHNMGRSCVYCTLWADGLNGLTQHFENRAAFVVCSPDEVSVQQEFATSRGWNFKMVSDASKEFSAACGYWNEKDGFWPAVSTFTKVGDKIYRTGKFEFGPGDDACAIWPIMDLLGGPKGWEPKYSYRESMIK